MKTGLTIMYTVQIIMGSLLLAGGIVLDGFGRFGLIASGIMFLIDSQDTSRMIRK